MKKLLLITTVALVILSFSIDAFAYYNFLSPECNIYLEKLREKYKIGQDYEEDGFVWAVIAPECDSKKVNEHTEIIEGQKYTITEIVIVNPRGPVRVIWGLAAKSYPYDVPRITIIHQ
jgi:hypothetical protein